MRVIHHYHRFDNPPTGGVENYIYSLSTALPRIDFIVISDLLEKSKQKERIKNIEVIRVPPVKPFGKGRIKDILFNTARREKEKLRLFEKYSPAIIHLHGPTNYTNLSLLGSLFYPFYSRQSWTKVKSKKLFTFHGLPGQVMKTKYKSKMLVKLSRFLWGRIEKKNIKDAEKIICVDRYVYDDLVKRKYQTDKIVFIPNGVDTTNHKPANKKNARQMVTKKYSVPLTGPVFLFAGRLSEEKGFRYILSMQQIKEKFTVLICGEGPYKDQVHDLCKKDSRFVYLGTLHPQELPLLYNAADMTLNPSLHPGATRTTIESLCCGTPTLMFNIGSRYPLVHAKTGVICSSDDFVNQVTNACHKGVVTLSPQMVRKIRKEFNIRSVARKVCEIYKEIGSKS